MHFLQRFIRFTSLLGIVFFFWALANVKKLLQFPATTIYTVVAVYFLIVAVDVFLSAKSFFRSTPKALIVTLLFFLFSILVWFIA